MKTVTLFLLFISITSLLSSSVYAYTLFSPNPSFDTNISYALGYSSAYYHIPNYTWSSSCYGLNGCLNITTDNLTNIQVQLYDQNTFLDTHNSSDFTGHNTVTLPANKEGIVVLRYRSTQDFYGYEGQMAYPKLYVVQRTPTYVVINDTSLISLNDTWYNYTVIVPATSYARNISIVFGFSSYQPPTEFDIDKFKFYTLDTIESSENWNLANYSYWCGNDSTSYGYGTHNAFNTGYDLKFANITDDNIYCDMVKLNNIIVVRRATLEGVKSETGDGSFPEEFNLLHAYHDSYLIADFGYSFTQPPSLLLFNAIFLRSFTLTGSSFDLMTQTEDGYAISTIIGKTNSATETTYNLLNSTSTGAFQTSSPVNLTQYSNQLPVGTLWRVNSHSVPSYQPAYTTVNGESGNHTFFDSSSEFNNPCTPHYSCSSVTNNQSYVNSDCSVTNQTYCSECGCSPYGDYCLGNAVITGSYCDLSDNTSKKFNTYLFGGCVASEINDTCGTNQICIQHILSGQHTIECFNTITGTHDYCINETGGLNANCTGIPLTPLCKVNGVLSDCKSEPIALGIGSITSALGVVGSFLLSLIVSFVISIFILSRDKKGNWGMPSFMVSMLISLGGFTYIGMFPIWFFVVATAIIILGIYFAFRGGKD